LNSFADSFVSRCLEKAAIHPQAVTGGVVRRRY
jgi:hypothetical protein